MIVIFAIVGAVIGWLAAGQIGRGRVTSAVVGAVGGAAGGVGLWVLIGLLGLLVGALGAVAGALILLWLVDRWRD
ncbi:GlsB/YeaQ/YmgE family stress response membrane protein [Paracoccus luteus]|uniref:GlsB/YeaQ/YmgE family stress response membrane protein n=1 Tax=Paracoccus luteus TaxID=2508543 RepID=UPI00106F4977|nr:GlsB/YeaQ/YmgE family stress response membrane protein [Paracoccus luteus]